MLRETLKLMEAMKLETKASEISIHLLSDDKIKFGFFKDGYTISKVYTLLELNSLKDELRSIIISDLIRYVSDKL